MCLTCTASANTKVKVTSSANNKYNTVDANITSQYCVAYISTSPGSKIATEIPRLCDTYLTDGTAANVKFCLKCREDTDTLILEVNNNSHNVWDVANDNVTYSYCIEPTSGEGTTAAADNSCLEFIKDTAASPAKKFCKKCVSGFALVRSVDDNTHNKYDLTTSNIKASYCITKTGSPGIKTTASKGCLDFIKSTAADPLD